MPNTNAIPIPIKVSKIRSLKRYVIFAKVGSVYNNNQNTRKVEKTGVIYRRLLWVAAAAIRAPPARAPIINGGRLSVSNREAVDAPTNTEIIRQILRDLCTSWEGLMTNSDAPTIQPMWSTPSKKPVAVDTAAVKPNLIP